MGDLAFGFSFDMLTSGKKARIPEKTRVYSNVDSTMGSKHCKKEWHLSVS
jgi:hypothetical protein